MEGGVRDEREVEVEERTAKKPKLPIWKTAKHGTEVAAKITLPHVVDSFTAQHMMADALPACCGVVSLEVKYVMFPNFYDSRKLADECWEDYIEATRVKPIKKGGAK